MSQTAPNASKHAEANPFADLAGKREPETNPFVDLVAEPEQDSATDQGNPFAEFRQESSAERLGDDPSRFMSFDRVVHKDGVTFYRMPGGLMPIHEEGLGVSVYDPIDLAVDVMTGGGSALARGAGKMATKNLARFVGKGISHEAAMGGAAGAGMAAADKLTGNPFASLAAGLATPVAVSSAMTGARRALALALRKRLGPAAKVAGSDQAAKAVLPETGLVHQGEAEAGPITGKVEANLPQVASSAPSPVGSLKEGLENTAVEGLEEALQPAGAPKAPDLGAYVINGPRALAEVYQRRVGDPAWRFLSETLPQKAGDRHGAIEAVNKALITDYRKPADYLKGRDLAKAEIQHEQERALELADTLGRLSPAEQKRAAQIVRGGITTQPERYREALLAADEFEALEKDLRALGVLKGDTYLTKHTRAQRATMRGEIEKLDRRIKELGASSMQFPGKAGIIEKLSAQRDSVANKLSQHYKSSGEKYLKRAYEKWESDSGVNLQLWPFQKKPSRMDLSYTQRRQDLSKEARRKLGEIETAPYLVGKGLLEQYHDRELARWFGQVADNPAWAVADQAQAAEKGFRQLPESRKLGRLSGMWVDPYIHDDIQQAINLSGPWGRFYDGLLNAWKAGKVLYNPATWSRNVMSNFILADMVADLSPHRVDVFAAAAKDIANKGSDYQALKEMGKLGNEWFGAEIKRFLPEFQEGRSVGLLRGLWRMGQRTTDKLGSGYQGIEQLFKVAVFKHRRDLGDSPEAAADMAEKAIFDYSKIPPAIRWAKRFYSPFVTFTYKALPRFAETAVTKPWKVAKYVLVAKGVEQAARLAFGESPEEAAREKEILPDYMARQTAPGIPSHLRLPLKDKHGRSKYLDLTYLLPWGDIGEQWGQSDITFRPLLPSHPLFNIASDLYQNQEGFSGKKLISDWQTPGQKAETLTGYLWRQAMPSLAGSWSWDKLQAAFSGELDRLGRPRSKWEAVLDTIFGLKIRSIDYNQEAVKRMRGYQRQVQDMRFGYSRELAEMERNGVDPERINEKLQEYQAGLARIMDQVKGRLK